MIIRKLLYTDKFGNTVGFWIADTHGYIEEEGLEEDYSETKVPDGILMEMWINSGEDTAKYMIIDSDFKNIECQMVPYKFISYKVIRKYYPAGFYHCFYYVINLINLLESHS